MVVILTKVDLWWGERGQKFNPCMAQLWILYNSKYQDYYVSIGTHLFTHPFFHVIQGAEGVPSNECLLWATSLAQQLLLLFCHLIPVLFLQSRSYWPIVESRKFRLGEVKRTAKVTELCQSQDSKSGLMNSQALTLFHSMEYCFWIFLLSVLCFLA